MCEEWQKLLGLTYLDTSLIAEITQPKKLYRYKNEEQQFTFKIVMLTTSSKTYMSENRKTVAYGGEEPNIKEIKGEENDCEAAFNQILTALTSKLPLIGDFTYMEEKN